MMLVVTGIIYSNKLTKVIWILWCVRQQRLVGEHFYIKKTVALLVTVSWSTMFWLVKMLKPLLLLSLFCFFIWLITPFLPWTALVVPDGPFEKVGHGDEFGSEEDFLYKEFCSSGHRFGHPGGGGGEQLAINEVLILEIIP